MKKVILGVVIGFLVALSIPLAVADITDTFAITVSNEVVRPVSEDLRTVYYKMKSLKNTYAGQINTLFPVNGGPILDGRDTVQPITADDARRILLFANTYITAYETSGVAEMTKPCVRQLEVR